MKALAAGFVGALVLLSGCASVRDQITPADLAARPFGAIDPATASAHAPRPTDPHPINVLVMSAGGADGAFGVGVLNGWTQSGHRPQFDVVTGVSTGALAATQAFLGPAYDTELTDSYLGTSSRDVFRSRGPLAAVLKDSLFDTGPLAATLARELTQQVLDAVAAEHVKGRRLFVATTNLDTSGMVVWDMGAVASSSRPDRLELYRRIILASASIPASFNPVYMKGEGAKGAQMQVDGAVRSPALLQGFMLGPPGRPLHVWVIVNSGLKPSILAKPVRPRVITIATRAALAMYRALTEQTIYQAYVITRRAGGDFDVLYVPDDSSGAEDPVQFAPQEIARFYRQGVAEGMQGRWAKEPQGLEPLLRIPR